MSVDGGAISAWLSTQPDQERAVAFTDTFIESSDTLSIGGKMNYVLPQNFGDILSDLALCLDIPALPANVCVETDASGVRRAVPVHKSVSGIRHEEVISADAMVNLVSEYNLMGGTRKLLTGIPRLSDIWRQLEGDGDHKSLHFWPAANIPQTLMLPLRFNLSNLPCLPIKALYQQELKVQVELNNKGSIVSPEVGFFPNPAYVQQTVNFTNGPTSILPHEMQERYDRLRWTSLPNKSSIDVAVAEVQSLGVDGVLQTSWIKTELPDRVSLRRNSTYNFVNSEVQHDQLCYLSPDGLDYSHVELPTKYVFDSSSQQIVPANDVVMVRGSYTKFHLRPYKVRISAWSSSVVSGGSQTSLVLDSDPAIVSKDQVQFLSRVSANAVLTIGTSNGPSSTFRVLSIVNAPGQRQLTLSMYEGQNLVLGQNHEVVVYLSEGDMTAKIKLVCDFTSTLDFVDIYQDERDKLTLPVTKLGTIFACSPIPGCYVYFPNWQVAKGSGKQINFTISSKVKTYRLALIEDDWGDDSSNWFEYQDDADKTSSFFYSSDLRSNH
jgi:hypothetical protein